MKNVLKFAFGIFAATFLFYSCSKDSVTEVLGSASAKIDGAAWQASMVGSAAAKVGDSSIVITLVKVVTSSDNEKIILTAKGIATGTYELKPPTISGGTGTYKALFTYQKSTSSQDSTNNIFVGKSGTVTISKIDGKKISGTFQFTGYSGLTTSKQFTEGKFDNITYVGK